MLVKWEKIPEEFKNDACKKYYDILKKKKVSLFIKRVFDFRRRHIIQITADNRAYQHLPTVIFCR